MNQNPKPFHIGTEVQYAIDHDLDPGRVVFAAERKSGEMVAFVVWPEETCGDPDPYTINELVHADDGSPLGEWVPISEEQWATAPLSQRGINAIIRGEVSQ